MNESISDLIDELTSSIGYGYMSSVVRDEWAVKFRVAGRRTMADEFFGLTAEEHAEMGEHLYKEIEELREWGEIPPGTAYYDVADAFLDTILGVTGGMGDILPEDVPDLIKTALDQEGTHG